MTRKLVGPKLQAWFSGSLFPETHSTVVEPPAYGGRVETTFLQCVVSIRAAYAALLDQRVARHSEGTVMPGLPGRRKSPLPQTRTV
jgi:hypothetical protein